MYKQKGRGRFVFLCVAPAVILFTVFMVIPTLQVFWLSLFKWGGYSAEGKTFVGLSNFQKLLGDEKFLKSFQNTILLIVLVTIVTFAFALVFAGILTREKIKGQNFFRIIFYIPNILSVVVIAAIFNAIYDPNSGLLNSILSLFREGQSRPLAGRPETGGVQFGRGDGMAGDRLLHGHVHGEHVRRTREPV